MKKKFVKSLTVAPFDVDVHAHLDPAEDLVLGHGHLHGRRLHGGDTICLMINELVSSFLEAAALLVGNFGNAVKGVLKPLLLPHLPLAFSVSQPLSLFNDQW